jgi:transposase
MSKKSMARHRSAPRYTAEFKAEAVELVRRGGRPIAQLASELGVSEQSLYRWVQRAAIDEKADPSGPLTTSERAELASLRRRLREVEMERDFLKRTAAYFASGRK